MSNPFNGSPLLGIVALFVTFVFSFGLMELYFLVVRLLRKKPGTLAFAYQQGQSLWKRFPQGTTLHITGACEIEFDGDIDVNGRPASELSGRDKKSFDKKATLLIKHGRVVVLLLNGGTLRIVPPCTKAKTGFLTCWVDALVAINASGAVSPYTAATYEAIDIDTVTFTASGQLKATDCRSVACNCGELVMERCESVLVSGTARAVVTQAKSLRVSENAVVYAQDCAEVRATDKCVIRTQNCPDVRNEGSDVVWEKV